MIDVKTRIDSWNYGGKNWRLSRSKIDLFLQCKKCFYLDNKLGITRPKGFPFNLNSAVDALLKKEFDKYRKLQKPHPLMEKYEIDAIPFLHEQLNIWRDNFKGIEYLHPDFGFIVSGAVDDVWMNKDGLIHVVDYKSTSKTGKIEVLDADWHSGYKRQMEVYQWILRKNGFEVSDIGYFVYANAMTNEDAFDARLKFDMTIIEYAGNDEWIDETLREINFVLNSDQVPLDSENCEYCKYSKLSRDFV